MKKQLVIGLAAIIVLFFVTGLALAKKHKLPPPKAKALWEWVTETDPYQGWGYWPGHVGLYSGQSPHGAYLKFYANSIALKAVREGKNTLPHGSILMKLNYAEDKKTLMALTPMYKYDGYNPEAGDWFWAKYKPNGEALASGKVQSCIDCHRVKKDNDWIFTPSETTKKE